MPRGIVERAAEILEQLERQRVAGSQPSAEGSAMVPAVEPRQISAAPLQLSIFETVDPLAGKLRAAIKALDLHAMTPIECMLRLNELKTLLEENEG